MSFSKIASGAAMLLALTPTAMAVGTASIVNNCGFPIYYASVGQSQHDTMELLQGSYSQSYSTGGVGNGISIKLAPTEDGHVSQFEFTWADGKINYDLSNIDGYPFADGGMTLVPSMSGDSNNPTCVPIDCPAGDAVCKAAYNLPDDTRTHVCADAANLVLTMCPNGSSGTPTSGTPSSSSSSDAGTTPTEAATASPVVSEAPAPATTTKASGGWGGKPPAKREEHVHQRIHARSFK